MLSHPVLTPYPDVQKVLSLIHAGIQSILQMDYVSLILHGSMAAGGFDPDRSDVDFLVVTEQAVESEPFNRLAAMHEALSGSGLAWATNIEGSYIHRSALYRYDPGDCVHPALRCDGSFGWDGHGPDWVLQRWNIREYGIVLFGEAPRSLIAPISPDEMRSAVLGILLSWWEPMLVNEYRLDEPEYQAYAVMTMCRSFYTLTTGKVASKPEAAAFALARLSDTPWAALIREGAAWRHGMVMDRKEMVKGFIRFTIAACKDAINDMDATKNPGAPGLE